MEKFTYTKKKGFSSFLLKMKNFPILFESKNEIFNYAKNNLQNKYKVKILQN